MAGPTTQASSAMGTVTEAQMARILIKEYCLGLAGVSSWAGNDWVFVMSLSLARTAIPHIDRRARDRPISYVARVRGLYACRPMRGALRRRTVLAWL